MTIKEICSELAKREAKLKQAPIGNVRELVAIISDLMVEDSSVIQTLLSNGSKRAKKAKKK